MTRPAAIKEFSDAILRLKWAVQDARLSVAERRELDDSIMDVEVAHAERLRVSLEPDPVEQRPPSYGLLMEALGNLHQHATHIAGSGRLVELIHAAHMASLEYAKATRWAPPTDKWSAAARAVMERSTPAEGTPVRRIYAPCSTNGCRFASGHAAMCEGEMGDGICAAPVSAPMVCSAVVSGHVTGGVLVTYRCVLPRGHDGEHADALAAGASDLVALDLSDCEDVP